ncbi:neutral zinc metallopeptidase [Pseudonocardia sp. H11422]|uniref:neutral zinc metallopeptidase n=1 Tax=Pseudonocardia sp. H11422 TaxID=2835866 RepID=UPI001BDD024D|nr:neutral zinc metallopeptidase [Pseudonocardia sp. H11422]
MNHSPGYPVQVRMDGVRVARGRSPRGARVAARLVAPLVVTVLVVVAGCAQVLPGRTAAVPATSSSAGPDRGGPGPVPPGEPPAAPGPTGPLLTARSTDEVAALTAEVLQDYWRARFPADFGRPWTDIGEFAPVRPGDPGAGAPPCVSRAADLTGQAFYCPAADAVVWDAEGLLPALRDRFGPVGPVVVLAHEIGHAVSTRLGVDAAQRREPASYPTILLEAMADCHAGAAIRHLVDTTTGGSAQLSVGLSERDAALLALIGFRDPLGIEAGDRSAHGNGFDRVSAFQDGYADGPARCAAMTLENREFTQRRFGSAADRARDGNLPLGRLLAAVGGDAPAWYGEVVAHRAPGSGWRAPEPAADPARSACDPTELAAQGAARFCTADGSVSVDRVLLSPLQEQFGDYAGATLIASRYGLAALQALGRPTQGPAAGRVAVCLAGAYTGRLIDPAGGFGLSPGDLDEAVQVLLAGDWAERDARGQAETTEHGYERVQRFRTGLLSGPGACGLTTAVGR